MSLSHMPSDVVATLSKYMCCEELMQLVHTGCKRLIKHLAATKVDLSVTPNHYGYLNISRLIHSLQRTFPSAKTVAFESSELVKLPVHLPANFDFDCQSSVIDHLVWPIESLAFHEKGSFAVAFATFMAINGLYRMNNIFPALMTLTVDTKMMFASTPDPIKDMLPFIPSSCIRIELDQHESVNSNVAQYEMFKDRILSPLNNRQMTSLCLRPLPLTQTELCLPQFRSLESLEIQCRESIDMSVLPRSLTSIVLDAAYSVDRRVSPLLEQVVFSNAPPNLIRFSSTLKLNMMDSTLPASLVHLRTHDVEDLNHAIHATKLPRGLRKLEVYGSIYDERDVHPYQRDYTMSGELANHLFYNIPIDDDSWQRYWPTQLQIRLFGSYPQDDFIPRLEHKKTLQTEYTRIQMLIEVTPTDCLLDKESIRQFFMYRTDQTLVWDARMVQLLRQVDSNQHDGSVVNAHVFELRCTVSTPWRTLNCSHEQMCNDMRLLLPLVPIVFTNLHTLCCSESVFNNLESMPSWVRKIRVDSDTAELSIAMPSNMGRIQSFVFTECQPALNIMSDLLLHLPIHLVTCSLHLASKSLHSISDNVRSFITGLPCTVETLSIRRNPNRGFANTRRGPYKDDNELVFAASKEFESIAPLLPPNLKDLNLPCFKFTKSTMKRFIDGCRLISSLRRLLLTCVIEDIDSDPQTLHCHTANVVCNE